MFSESVWSLLGMLAVVVLILFLAYYATKWIGTYSTRATSPRPGAGGGDGGFRVLAQLSVGRNERLLLVRLGDKCCLLGVTANSITLLKDMEETEAQAFLAAREIPPATGFVDVLKENLRKKK